MRGRLAPSPTGLLHVGHARTFALAHARTRAARGTLVLRIEDLDAQRCQAAFTTAALADLRWLGLHWDEGPDVGGPHAPYVQSARTSLYLDVWRQLGDAGAIYPCTRSRRDVLEAAGAPHVEGEEPVYPPAFRPPPGFGWPATSPHGANWRFRVPDGREIHFHDGIQGPQAFVAGRDFGDFIVWRHDGVPAYQLAVVADDHAMEISEVVRGADLLVSTARQLLLYEALGWPPPAVAHAPLVLGPDGRRLAKRSPGLSLADLRASGLPPAAILAPSA